MTTPDSHSRERNFIEGILRKIPGFKGYLEKEYRRDSDHLARVWMADQLNKAKSGIDSHLQDLVSNAQIDDLPQFERVRSRIDGLMSKMRGDVRGYSGFFDYVRVDEDLLSQIYDHDLMLMNDVEVFERSIDKVAGGDKPPAEVAAELLRQVEELESKYERRGEMLLGVSGQ